MGTAYAVIDLGFGDAGKGSIVDFLARGPTMSPSGAGVVVRWHGGAQAGHRVVAPDGRAHVFAQFGAGSFVPHVKTHLAEGFVLDPLAMLGEAAQLDALGVPSVMGRLSIDPRALVITPFARAANRLRERARGAGAHGSCGIGFGETVRLSLLDPDLRITVSDLHRPASLPRRLRRIQEHLRADLADVFASVGDAPERALFESSHGSEAWIASLAPLLTHDVMRDGSALRAELAGPRPVIFEGAQGVLLDEWMGFHPHTTWSTCTSHGFDALLDTLGHDGERLRFGLMRSYMTRHGQGPMPTHEAALNRLPEAANGDTGWQGHFRRGWLDMTLLRYALEVSPVDALAVTHLDCVDETFHVAASLLGPDVPGLVEGHRLVPSSDLEDLEHQQRLTDWLNSVRPELTPTPDSESLIARVETELSRPVRITSSGPSAHAKNLH
ncbi:MAG: adenylosuccinate synthetase [Sandaracinaceae bacterium]